jgi:hypothetical protein
MEYGRIAYYLLEIIVGVAVGVWLATTGQGGPVVGLLWIGVLALVGDGLHEIYELTMLYFLGVSVDSTNVCN